jgi:hypothetical protein
LACALRVSSYQQAMTSRTLGMLMAASLASFAWADDEPTGTYSALVDVGDEPAQLCLTVDARGMLPEP